ncbi:MAG: efflux RND transporter periplasmic adaptor subunit [Sphingomonadaceae bacterium]|nr:efflux RND transporter periplasmic adaptor subunit [Sphingomonadaceae bacterium]
MHKSLAAAALALLLTGCGGKPKQGPPPPPTVGVVTVRTQPVAITTELQGRTDAFVTSDVRPQVSGIIRRRLFTEGSRVRKGQPLYLIDPAPYRAALAQALAQLQSAQANRVTAELKNERYQQLVKVNAVAKQDADDARAAAGQAVAAVGEAQAQVQTARINLHYTNVNAPISGRIGRSSVTVGALVTASQTDALATISALDPIYVDIQQSSTDLLQLKRQLAQGGAVPDSAPVKLKLEDGTDYPLVGKLEFSEVTVDASTGSVTLRARFPNPHGLLLPGMFARAILQQATRPDGILIPQAGVSRDPKGNATVLVLAPGNKAAQRPIVTAGTIGTDWIVTSGLKPGERVIVEGLQAVKPGQQVKPMEASVITGGTAPAASADTALKLTPEQQKQAASGNAAGGGGGSAGGGKPSR